jgi:hypothetical protein
MAKKSIMETNLEVAVQWHPYKNPHADAIEGEYAPGSQKCPYNFTRGSVNPTWWLCRNVTCTEGCPHEWPASIYNRCKAKPTGCPFCSKPKRKFCIHESIPYTHPELAKQWHPYKNFHADAIEGEYAPGNQHSPYNFTHGCNIPKWWLCPVLTCTEGCLHEWPTPINSKKGCPFCGVNSKRRCIHHSIPYTHPDAVKQWHPYKNTHADAVEGEYAPGSQQSPYNFTHGSQSEVWWMCPSTCPEGCLHEWPALIQDITSGNGCPVCSNKKVTCIHQSIAHTDPELAKQWHPTKNGDLKPDSFTRRSNVPVWWLVETGCSEGCTHEVYTQINCKSIGDKYICIHQSIAHTHPEIAKEFHPTLNGELKPEHLTYGSDERPWWLCAKGHCWPATVSNRCRLGRGCSKCCNSRGYSKVACEWINTVSESTCTFAQHEENGGEYKIPEMPGTEVDGFMTAYNDYNRIALEFHGCQFHGCPTCRDLSANNHLGQSFAELYQKTNERTRKLRNHGYIVIEIWECEYATLKRDDTDWKKWFEDKLAETN